MATVRINVAVLVQHPDAALTASAPMQFNFNVECSADAVEAVAREARAAVQLAVAGVKVG